MNPFHIAVGDIPAHGRELVVSDENVWTKPIQDLHIDCKIVEPLCVKVLATPLQGGILVRGKLTGRVALACDLCAEVTEFEINHSIDAFESIPGESIDFEDGSDDDGEDFEDALADSESRVVLDKNIPYLDMGALCWEELMLALPMRPLCQDNCQGLCPTCGINLNESVCACTQDQGDPRLAVLRNLKITSK